MYVKDMQKIIHKALMYDIHNISTYDGYDGADILKFEIFDTSVVTLLRDFTRNAGFSAVVKMPVKSNAAYELYCVFEKTESYSLKQ